MKSLDNRFFPRGGFSSSQWNHIRKSNDANALDSFCQNTFLSGDLISNQIKSKRIQKRFGCDLST